MNRGINFGASTYEKPNDPSEYLYAYLFKWTASFIQELGKIGLPFEPYMVNSGEWYVISANVINDKLTNLADVILNVKDRVVEKCGVEVEGKPMGDVKYSDVFLSLVRNRISHIPPDIDSARQMAQNLYFAEQDLIDRLGNDFGVERFPTTPITMVTMAGVWDSTVRIAANIVVLKRLVKQCEDMTDDKRGAAVTEAFLAHGNMKATQRKRHQELGNDPKLIN